MPKVATKYRGKKDYFLVFGELVNAAQYRGTVSYTQVARLMGIRETGNHMGREVGQILGEISEDEVERDRPMLSALAVSSVGVPSEGFFDLAADLGLLKGTTAQDKERFWSETKKALYDCWRKPS